MPQETVIYRRDVLYAEVWSEPATTVAQRYAISSVALAKFCRRLHVPLPSRGYWAKQAVGKQEPMPPLPPLPCGATEQLVITRRRRTLDADRKQASKEKGRATMGTPIVVPHVLEQPHPLITRTLPLFEHPERRNGLLRASSDDGVDVAASPALLDRAVRIMNALLLALETRGLSVEVADGATRALVGDVWVRFRIVECLKQHVPEAKKPPRNLHGTDREWWQHWNRPRMQLVPTGKLSLEIKEADVGVRVSWVDGHSRIEENLNDFAAHLFVVAEAKKAARESDANWRKSFEAEAERSRHAQAKAERRQRKEAHVLGMLERWKQAKELREFVDEMKLASIRTGESLPRWVTWAERFAERIDPRRAKQTT